MRRLITAMGAQTLRRGLSIDEAADIIWVTASSEPFVLVTGERGWNHDWYECWVHDTWCRLLLESRAEGPTTMTDSRPG